MPMDVGASGSYPTSMGLMYVFNLIVGTGALALPKAFQEAGYALGAALLVCSCMISYVCATFVIESMSCANAVIESRRKQQAKQAEYIRAAHRTSVDNDDGDRALAERRPLLHASPHASASASILPSNLELASSVTDECYDIKERVELSQMAQLFLGKAGLIACYFILTVYLFGDLAIYSATVPKSFMNVLCSGGQVNNSLSHDSPCHSSWPAFFTRFTVYRIVVVVFNLLVGPLVFIGMTKTKYLQFVTTVFRWAAFLIMIGMASESLASHGPSAHPAAATFGNFGSLFGVTVYAFMCHHSLPGLITPMKDKQNVFKLLFVVFALILTFYLALSLTGSFAFAKVEDVYTLNFLNSLSTDTSHIAIVVIDYFLALFPVITISTNFPIVGITLKNNMNTLITLIADRSGQKSRSA
uniref:Amino acid transporter transmembrane domain-containing protein n=1 Tax=Plectus sambesii TaxID=2011161 RepID=A0A914WWC4_9BILA